MDPKPELTSLPDVPSRAIVSLLPLQQVITTLPRLHSRFAPIRESVLKSNQCLVLYIGDRKKIKAKKCRSQLGVPFASHLVDSNGSLLSPDTSFHRLHLLTLSQHSVEQLSTLMPNLTYLEVAIANVDISVIPNLITLLTFWGPSLQTLKLLIREFKSSNDEHLQQTYLPTVASHLRSLICLINNQCVLLENLSLDLDDSFIDRYKGRLDQKIDVAIFDVLRFQDGFYSGPKGLYMPAINLDDAVRRLKLLLHEIADILNREPPNEAANADEVLAQTENIHWHLGQKHRFTSEMLFKGDKEDSVTLEFLSILGQLKEFSIDTGRESLSRQPFILQALEKYGSNRLTSISIAEANTWGQAWSLSALAHHRFASRFTRLPTQYELAERDDTDFLHVFTNLKVYTVNWYHLGPTHMALLSGLASLPKLQCLKLAFFSGDTLFLNENFASLPAFSTVTVLEIFMCHIERTETGHALTHEYLQVPYWAHLFPQVQIIKLVNDGTPCLSCFPNEVTLMFLPIQQVLPCVKLLLAPLRELPSLRKIFYQQNEQIDAISEFTPQGELAQTHEYVY